jgi:hypothetical protein
VSRNHHGYSNQIFGQKEIEKLDDPLGNSLAPHRIFNAILRLLFSAAAELAPLTHPRRPTSSGSLEEQTEKAKSSMVAAAISQNLYLD